MPIHSAHSRCRVQWRSRVLIVGGLLVVGLTCVLLVASLSLFAPDKVSGQQGAREAEALVAPAPMPPARHAGGSGGRVVYRYSVVPGGVYSVGALARAMEDPVVATHYAGIDISRARVATIPAFRRVYVSYRIGGRVFWTKHAVTLHPGARILTDGRSEILARCGNSISATRREPTSPQEPEVAELDRAIVPEATAPPALLTSSGPNSTGPLPAPVPLLDVAGESVPPISDGGPGSGAIRTETIPPGGSSKGDDPSNPGGFPVMVSPRTSGPPVSAVTPKPGTSGGPPTPPADSPDAQVPSGLAPDTLSPPVPGETPIPATSVDVSTDTPADSPNLDGPFETGTEHPFPPGSLETPLEVTPIPEPGSVVLVGTGIAGYAVRAWRRRRRGAGQRDTADQRGG